MKSLFPLLLFLTPALVSAASNPILNPDLPNASTLTKEYLEQMAQRNRGQTSFVVKNQVWSSRTQEQSPQSQQQQEQQDSANRDIQESDVFKLGNQSKKELFLLNNYRGFQVVSFEDGVAKPKLIGRLPIFNNWGSEMYYLEKEEKVMILNTEYDYTSDSEDTSDSWASHYNTVVYMVDVSNSKEPKIENKAVLSGYLEQSRLVGDVLYTITHNGKSEKQVKVASLKMGDGLEVIEEVDLNSENRYIGTMNVVKENGRYYVISTATNWNSDGDLVNVHDITSPNGKIHKVFTAKIRGRVSERSQTFMHKGHLFAVSNYREDGAPLRVSVEAFPIVKKSSVVTSKPNMRVSVGDTNGLNASLQDVRVSGDHLYAFWVPANNVDPFELFDISKPQEGIKHLGQLQFDGWISKAFPLTHEGKNYVLGLGWVAPVTNENGRRMPQAKLFEIKQENGKFKHEVVSSLTIESEDIWTSFNSEDKYFEVMNDGPGKFNILFPVTFYGSWKDGAKVVTADLNTLNLAEGASVQGQHGWLKRIFTNKPMEALHAFSDERLESFDAAKLSDRGFSKTVSVLELARNILSFHPVSETHGIQVVSQDDSMEVRTVNLKKVDSEKVDVLDTKTIPGKHVWHKVKGSKLYTVTSFEKDNKFTEARLNVLDLLSHEYTSNKIDITEVKNEYYYLNLRNVTSLNEELFIIGSELFRLQNDQMVKVSVTESCKYFFNNDSGNLSLQSFGKDILAFNSFKLTTDLDEDGKKAKYAYYMPFFKVIDFEGTQVTCSKSINVPGKPVLAKGEHIVTSNDTDDWYDYEYYGQDIMKRSVMPKRKTTSLRTIALKLEDNGAKITDFLNKNISSNTFADGFVTYESEEKALNLWTLDDEGEFTSKYYFLDGRESAEFLALKNLGKKNLVFMQKKKAIDVYEIAGGKKIKFVESIPVETAPYSVNDISASQDLKSFYLAQGMYGVTELKMK